MNKFKNLKNKTLVTTLAISIAIQQTAPVVMLNAKADDAKKNIIKADIKEEKSIVLVSESLNLSDIEIERLSKVLGYEVIIVGDILPYDLIQDSNITQIIIIGNIDNSLLDQLIVLGYEVIFLDLDDIKDYKKLDNRHNLVIKPDIEILEKQEDQEKTHEKEDKLEIESNANEEEVDSEKDTKATEEEIKELDKNDDLEVEERVEDETEAEPKLPEEESETEVELELPSEDEEEITIPMTPIEDIAVPITPIEDKVENIIPMIPIEDIAIPTKPNEEEQEKTPETEDSEEVETNINEKEIDSETDTEAAEEEIKDPDNNNEEEVDEPIKDEAEAESELPEEESETEVELELPSEDEEENIIPMIPIEDIATPIIEQAKQSLMDLMNLSEAERYAKALEQRQGKPKHFVLSQELVDEYNTGKYINMDLFRQYFFNLLNNHRVNDLNYNPVRESETLKEGTHVRAVELAENKYLEHERPDGEDFRSAFEYVDFERTAEEQGFTFNQLPVGENISISKVRSVEELSSEKYLAERIYEGWKGSESHYRYMTRESLKHISLDFQINNSDPIQGIETNIDVYAVMNGHRLNEEKLYENTLEKKKVEENEIELDEEDTGFDIEILEEDLVKEVTEIEDNSSIEVDTSKEESTNNLELEEVIEEDLEVVEEVDKEEVVIEEIEKESKIDDYEIVEENTSINIDNAEENISINTNVVEEITEPVIEKESNNI